jgi:hypothetical protein
MRMCLCTSGVRVSSSGGSEAAGRLRSDCELTTCDALDVAALRKQSRYANRYGVGFLDRCAKQRSRACFLKWRPQMLMPWVRVFPARMRYTGSATRTVGVTPEPSGARCDSKLSKVINDQ